MADVAAISRVRTLMGDTTDLHEGAENVPAPRPSLAVRAAVKAGGLSGKVFAVIGGIAFGAEIVARLWPTASHYISPLQAVLVALQGGAPSP